MIIVELFSMDFPRYNMCITKGNYYDYYNFRRDSISDEYLKVTGIPFNFKVGDLIKYPSKEDIGKKKIGYIMYMECFGSNKLCDFIIGVRFLDSENDSSVCWANKFINFILED